MDRVIKTLIADDEQMARLVLRQELEIVTAFHQHAIEAFDAGAIDCFTEPVGTE